jgi:hypothetical protein
MARLPYNKILGILQFQAEACGSVSALRIFRKLLAENGAVAANRPQAGYFALMSPQGNFRRALMAIDYPPDTKIFRVGGQ